MAQVINIAKYKTNNKINSIAKHNLRCYIPDNVDASKQKKIISILWVSKAREEYQD